MTFEGKFLPLDKIKSGQFIDIQNFGDKNLASWIIFFIVYLVNKIFSSSEITSKVEPCYIRLDVTKPDMVIFLVPALHISFFFCFNPDMRKILV